MASDELTNKAAEILGQLQGISPKAVDAALGAARVDAYTALLGGFCCLIGALAFSYFAWFKFKPWALKQSDDIFLIMGGLISGIITACLVLGVIVNLLDPWVYVTIAHPELWVAHKMMK